MLELAEMPRGFGHTGPSIVSQSRSLSSRIDVRESLCVSPRLAGERSLSSLIRYEALAVRNCDIDFFDE
jgi:hypothetical protein